MTKDLWDRVAKGFRWSASYGFMDAPSVENFIKDINDKYEKTGVLPDFTVQLTKYVCKKGELDKRVSIPFAYYAKDKQGVNAVKDGLDELRLFLSKLKRLKLPIVAEKWIDNQYLIWTQEPGDFDDDSTPLFLQKI